MDQIYVQDELSLGIQSTYAKNLVLQAGYRCAFVRREDLELEFQDVSCEGDAATSENQEI